MFTHHELLSFSVITHSFGQLGYPPPPHPPPLIAVMLLFLYSTCIIYYFFIICCFSGYIHFRDNFWAFYHKFQILGYDEIKVTTLLVYSTNLAHFSESSLGQRFMQTVLQPIYLHSFLILHLGRMSTRNEEIWEVLFDVL